MQAMTATHYATAYLTTADSDNKHAKIAFLIYSRTSGNKLIHKS